jgi:DNA polymerase III epsilon subunit-like protein
MTQNLGKLFIDIETTGLGQFGQYKNNPVAIWNFGYIDSGTNVSQELMADIGNVPFEDGALEVYKPQGLGPYRGRENAVPKVYSEYIQTYGQNVDDEKAMLQKIGNLFKENKGRTIAGYNIASFDIPFIAARFNHYGMTDELKALETLHIEDTLEKAKSFLRKRMPSSFLSQLSPGAFDEATRTRIYDLPDGFKLETLAEAFGISNGQSQTHTAKADADLAKQLDELLDNPQEAARRYSLSRHITARDAYVSSKVKNKPDVEIVRWETIAKQLGGPEALEEANNGLVEGAASDWTYKEPPKVAKDILKTSSVIDSTTSASPSTPAGNAVKQIVDEVPSVINNAASKVSSNFDNAIQLSKNIFTPKNIIIAGAVIGAGLIYKGIKSENANDRKSYISATNLGKNPGEVIKQYKLTDGKNIQQDIGKNPIADIGTKIHSIIEQ